MPSVEESEDTADHDYLLRYVSLWGMGATARRIITRSWQIRGLGQDPQRRVQEVWGFPQKPTTSCDNDAQIIRLLSVLL